MGEVKVYFDTISTSLRKDADLISIGMIANDPSIQLKSSIYVELTDYNRDKVTDWLDKNVIQNLLSDEEFNSLAQLPVFKCNRLDAEKHVFAWLEQIHNHAKSNGLEMIQLVGDLCSQDFQSLRNLLSHHDIYDLISFDYIDLNDELQNIYGFSAYNAFKTVRQVIIQEYEAIFDIHTIPPSFDNNDEERLIPKLIMDKENNALNNAFAIHKLDAYLSDIERLHLFDE